MLLSISSYCVSYTSHFLWKVYSYFALFSIDFIIDYQDFFIKLVICCDISSVICILTWFLVYMYAVFFATSILSIWSTWLSVP